MGDLGLMQVAVDAVVFTVSFDDLKILLIKRKYAPFKEAYALPGGFVKKDEELEDAAARELEEETGVKDIFLRQYATYGDVNRDPRGRVLSIAFLALINQDQKLHATTDASSADWHSVYDLPDLAFDHQEIVENAIKELRYRLQTTNIALQILPQYFTLTQFQRLYELVLDKPLDKRNFRKRIKELDVLKETNREFREGAHRPAKLYTFKYQKYRTIKDKINVFLN
ncbi:NUDIX hydrolase [archaeon]|jgi:8-oxo-dGTP diphosphatase|nr:NUDIX hydrolase [archaeon]MBT6762309.1 NUDIX hydrolase [archaeon]